jgi:DNA-binding response OmpR family regulator
MAENQPGSQDAPQQCDVLIVEDDVIQCEEMAGYLGRAGLWVQMAHDGATALRLAREQTPKVALLDYNLPDINGVQLAELLRPVLPQTAIIMMSGRIDGLSEQTLAKLGITVFVNKPLPLGPLRQAVLKLVQAAPTDRGGPPRQTGWLAAGYGGTRR